tara:strand:+ start:7264 stop:7863 length:600 start_codon:yes stop_codon:yes gene_type:complete
MATTYYLSTGEVWAGPYHTYDGHTQTGATHTSDSRVLSKTDPGESTQNPHIRQGHSPLETLALQALRQFGDFSPGTTDGAVLSMFIEFANYIVDDIRQHTYYTGYPVLDYYESVHDARPINDSIIRCGLLYHYAIQQGSDKMQIYAPMYHQQLNRHLWNELNGNTKIRLRIVDDGTNKRNFSDKTSTYNGLAYEKSASS